MAIDWILAMTAAEIRANSTLPPKIGWLGCHFSPCGTGLSNLPEALPPGSLLILDDLVPIHGHDPERIAAQLREVMGRLECECLLLDFQRPGEKDTAELAKVIVDAFPRQVCVSEPYADALDCPVFLTPVPPDVALEEHLAPWKGRKVWLDTAPDGQVITLTRSGAERAPLTRWDAPECPHYDETLHCHYRIDLSPDRAIFTLQRTKEDLQALLTAAHALGVKTAVGLYQELGR